jgi:hypothetical protein
MPWGRAKALPPPHLGIELFNAQFRIQREACEAAGHYIPMVVENVRGAQKWVGTARYHYGSFYFWGDVPALMPITFKAQKVPLISAHDRRDFGWNKSEEFQAMRREGCKTAGMNWSNRELRGQDFARVSGKQADGVKFSQSGDAWFDGKPRDKTLGEKGPAAYGSKSRARKRASAEIAKIPFPVSQHIARCFKPCLVEAAA